MCQVWILRSSGYPSYIKSNSYREAIKFKCDYLVEDHCSTVYIGQPWFLTWLSCNMDVFQMVT